MLGFVVVGAHRNDPLPCGMGIVCLDIFVSCSWAMLQGFLLFWVRKNTGNLLVVVALNVSTIF